VLEVLVAGFMVGPVWGLTWEVSTLLASQKGYDRDVGDNDRIPRLRLLENPLVWALFHLTG